VAFYPIPTADHPLAAYATDLPAAKPAGGGARDAAGPTKAVLVGEFILKLVEAKDVSPSAARPAGPQSPPKAK
jgi:hypothetical protein